MKHSTPPSPQGAAAGLLGAALELPPLLLQGAAWADCRHAKDVEAYAEAVADGSHARNTSARLPVGRPIRVLSSRPSWKRPPSAASTSNVAKALAKMSEKPAVVANSIAQA